MSTGADRICLVLGSASCVREDVEAALKIGRFDGLIVVNEMIARWPGPVTAAATLHPEHLKKWLDRRASARFPSPKHVAISKRWREALPTGVDIVTDSCAPGQVSAGSSGLFAVKVALFDLGFDKALCCGVPLTQTPHVGERIGWAAASIHQGGWVEAKAALDGRVKSMSGWTGELLGKPDREWFDV